jgi:glucose 1-dehydrogenase
MSMKRLTDEIAIVTGASSGIGQATALALANEGADVAITYANSRSGGEETQSKIEACGRRAYLSQLDVRDPAAIAEFFKQVLKHLGTPTILVNNAGVDASGTHVKDMSSEEWDSTVRTNLFGPFYTCQQFIRTLESTDKHGSIINITSVHQEIPRAGGAAYGASKGGLRNLTTALALELAEKNINVNNIAPGMVLTRMNQAALDDPEVQKKQVQSIPMKRAAQPEEIANVVVFLASEQARYIHGATITVDGALRLFMGQGA